MATPLGHYLVGVSITQGLARDSGERKRGLWLAVIACLPDLDFIPGFFVGRLGQFHHGITHSFAAAAIFSILAWLVFRWCARGISLNLSLVFLLYTSHVVLDFVTLDNSVPYGVPLFWPWSHDSYQSSWLLLPNVHHTRAPLFGPHNLLLMIARGYNLSSPNWIRPRIEAFSNRLACATSVALRRLVYLCSLGFSFLTS